MNGKTRENGNRKEMLRRGEYRIREEGEGKVRYEEGKKGVQTEKDT